MRPLDIDRLEIGEPRLSDFHFVQIEIWGRLMYNRKNPMGASLL